MVTRDTARPARRPARPPRPQPRTGATLAMLFTRTGE
jgi:hypothetical protein